MQEVILQKSSIRGDTYDHQAQNPGVVTGRCFIIGLVLSAAMAGFIAWAGICANVGFLGGMQMPFGAVFALLCLIVFVNGPVKLLRSGTRIRSLNITPLSPTELLVIYVMLLFAVLISSPCTDNFFLTTGPALFYFTTIQNRWAELFYEHVPPHLAPGWDGQVYQREVIRTFYEGGVSVTEIPWHAWTVMLSAWCIFLLLLYATLFFISLILRRQWVESEALAFPLVQLPLQMVDAAPPGTSRTNAQHVRSFWQNRTMWAGASLALLVHFLRGLNYYFSDWPVISAFQGNAFNIVFTETPWNSMGSLGFEWYLGAVGIAYLLTRELSFSFCFFFLIFKLQYVLATVMGYPVGALPQDTYLGRPTFITWQSTGAWLMMGLLLLWSAREHIHRFLLSALRPHLRTDQLSTEPFAPCLVLAGLVISVSGMIGWCLFSGINLRATIAFIGLYGLISLVITRLVIEGGFLYPQVTFAPLEMLTGSIFSAQSLGASSIVKLSMILPVPLSDMRTNLLPGFLHTLKIAHVMQMPPSQVRRLMLCAGASIAAGLLVSVTVTLIMVYRYGALSSYPWYTQGGPQRVLKGASSLLTELPVPSFVNWGWMGLGAGMVWVLTLARAQFIWFPLHPLAYLVSSGTPITKLWPSFFLAWALKSLLLRFGGPDTASRARPFMMGLIMGNVVAMMLWMCFGFSRGSQIGYWPA